MVARPEGPGLKGRHHPAPGQDGRSPAAAWGDGTPTTPVVISTRGPRPEAAPSTWMSPGGRDARVPRCEIVRPRRSCGRAAWRAARAPCEDAFGRSAGGSLSRALHLRVSAIDPVSPEGRLQQLHEDRGAEPEGPTPRFPSVFPAGSSRGFRSDDDPLGRRPRSRSYCVTKESVGVTDGTNPPASETKPA